MSQHLASCVYKIDCARICDGVHIVSPPQSDAELHLSSPATLVFDIYCTTVTKPNAFVMLHSDGIFLRENFISLPGPLPPDENQYRINRNKN